MKAVRLSNSNRSLLHTCARYAEHTHLKFLLDLGYIIDDLDREGRTPLTCSIAERIANIEEYVYFLCVV